MYEACPESGDGLSDRILLVYLLSETTVLILADMERREFLTALPGMLASIFCGCFFTGCHFIERKGYSATQFAYYLGYLLYGHNPPMEEVAKIAGYMQSASQTYAGLQSTYEQIYSDITVKTWPASFQDLSGEQQKTAFKKIMPKLLLHQEVADIIGAYLEESIVKILYYPDMPGSYGECGWLILEGGVWDRYYRK